MHLPHESAVRGREFGLSSICIFSALYLPSMGGVERFTDSLAGELARQGHSVAIVSNDTHGMGYRDTLSSGVEVFRLPCHNLLGGRYPVPVKNDEFRRLMGFLEARTFDGILINTRFYLHSLLGVEFAERHDLRAVVLDHGSAYLTMGNPLLDWFIARYEDVITAHLKRKRVEFYGISQKSVEWLRHFGIQAKGVISNSIDAASYRAQSSGRSFREELGIPQDDLMMAFTGRFIPEKGIAVLIDMMRLLENEPARLVMAGDGPLGKQVEESDLEAIHLVGRLDTPDIAALLSESDLFCLPTRSEGFSTSLLEASACGTPSLVTDVGGARELMPDDSYGFVVNEADAGIFARIVREAASGEYDLKEMGVRCHARVEKRYSWAAGAQELLKAFGC